PHACVEERGARRARGPRRPGFGLPARFVRRTAGAAPWDPGWDPPARDRCSPGHDRNPRERRTMSDDDQRRYRIRPRHTVRIVIGLFLTGLALGGILVGMGAASAGSSLGTDA